MITITIRADATRAIAAFAYAAHTSALHALRCGITRRQLTTGAENWCSECEDVHPPGQHTDPEPCLCAYVRHSARLVWGTLGKRVLAHDVVIATGFQIKPWCVHHGESRRDRWVDVPTGLPWETTLGPDETQP